VARSNSLIGGAFVSASSAPTKAATSRPTTQEHHRRRSAAREIAAQKTAETNAITAITRIAEIGPPLGARQSMGYFSSAIYSAQALDLDKVWGSAATDGLQALHPSPFPTLW